MSECLSPTHVICHIFPRPGPECPNNRLAGPEMKFPPAGRTLVDPIDPISAPKSLARFPWPDTSSTQGVGDHQLWGAGVKGVPGRVSGSFWVWPGAQCVPSVEKFGGWPGRTGG